MLNRVTVSLMLVELAVVLVCLRFVSWTAWKVVGAVILVGAMLLLITARMQLGSSFSVRAKATRLVTTGLYSRMRNPIYVFSTLLFVGVALLLGRWWPMVIALVLVPVQRARARREARVLQARFGEEYVQYRGRTWI